ncbi:MAG TPA: hypothetical protein VIJ25_07705, partial [Methylococcales bacterium]
MPKASQAQRPGIHSIEQKGDRCDGRARGYAVGTPFVATQEGFGKCATLFRSDIGGLHNFVDSNLEVV